MSYHLVLVRAFVRFQLTELGKTFIADFTAIWFFSCVKANMLIQLTRLSERLPTLVAFVGFFTWKEKTRLLAKRYIVSVRKTLPN